MPAFVAVGIDCSDDHHDIHAEAADERPPLRLRISNDLTGFQRLLDALKETFGDLPLKFALENPTLLIARFLCHAAYSVYPVNPRSVAHMRTALASSGKKDDRLDAEAICDLLRRRVKDLSPVQPGSSESAILAGLVRERVVVVEEKNRTVNQLTAVLKGFYPRALELFNNLAQPLTVAFLKAFPCPKDLSAATEEQWDALFAGQRYPRPGRIKTLWEVARKPQVTVSPADETLGVRQTSRLVRMLEVLLDDLQALEKEIQVRWEALPEAKIFRSLPGAADVLGPALFSIFGDDRSRWKDWEQVARVSGAVPVTVTSGKVSLKRMRYHCDRSARRILHLFAGCSRRSCEWADQFYRKQRALGKSHGTALRNLAVKWLRILFRLWQDGDTYDEKKYLQQRSRRAAPREAANPAIA